MVNFGFLLFAAGLFLACTHLGARALLHKLRQLEAQTELQAGSAHWLRHLPSNLDLVVWGLAALLAGIAIAAWGTASDLGTAAAYGTAPAQ